MVTGDTELKELSLIEELSGKLASDPETQRLMRSVIENDKDTVEEGKLIRDAINQGLGSFTPNMLFEQLVKSYSTAKQLFGETILKEATGFEPAYLERNIRIPEFRRELKKKLERLQERFLEKKLIDRENELTESAIKLASIIMYVEEVDELISEGISSEKSRKRKNPYGVKSDVKEYSRERYRDIAIRKTIRKSVRRGHESLLKEDLMSFERKNWDERQIIYCLDASASMKGKKLGQCKKAGIALAYRALDEKDKVGLAVFSSEVVKKIEPTSEFSMLLQEIVKIRASAQTDIAATIKSASELFDRKKATKHIILITDAIPTKGANPEKNALAAAAEANARKITVSVVGISLDVKGKKVAEKIAEIGKGRVFEAKDLEELDKIVLEDYRSIE
ncbi:VWA domain-containing protein [Candidatus Woesearchaeota archaeon]|nr:VWA domain-containing protein [Candidatus Woesearchaeota archaeon]